ncbi:MAG: MFS transporter [Alphaproteobacteria bacterium]
MNSQELVQRSDRILARAAWRLIPFMALMYVVAFLDRSNISFAALQMNKELGFSPQVYGNAAGIFFLGYFLFEVPSNLALQKVGARLWMCRICISWGFLSMLTAFCREPISFCIVRFLLGAAEAGLYPGMILYMTYWFPQSTRARFIALFLGGVPLSAVIGGPLSGWLLGVEGHGLSGWQWMMILEGIPSLICGVATLWALPDGPAKAKWLTDEEKRIVAARLAAEPPGQLHGLKEMLLDKRIWLLMIPDFSIVIALYGMGLWLPQMIAAMGYSNIQTGFISAMPYLLAMGAMVLLGASSDRSGERAGHVAFGALAGGAGLIGAVWFANHGLVILSLASRPAASMPRWRCSGPCPRRCCGHRGGRRPGAAQQLLQSGRVFRAHPDGMGQAADRQLHAWHGVVVGNAGSRRHLSRHNRADVFPAELDSLRPS